MSHVAWNHCRRHAYWVQPESFAKSFIFKVTGGGMMFIKDSSKPSRSLMRIIMIIIIMIIIIIIIIG